MRAAWGCDAPAQFPTFEITCPKCDGDGCGDQSDKAERREPYCEGGRLKFFRCASSATSREACALVASYVDRERGILPAPGGMQDQSRLWAMWMKRIGIERSRIEERRRAEEIAARDRATRLRPDGG